MKKTLILCAIFALATVISMSAIIYAVAGWWGVAIIIAAACLSFAPSVRLGARLWKGQKGGGR